MSLLFVVNPKMIGNQIVAISTVQWSAPPLCFLEKKSNVFLNDSCVFLMCTHAGQKFRSKPTSFKHHFNNYFVTGTLKKISTTLDFMNE